MISVSKSVRTTARLNATIAASAVCVSTAFAGHALASGTFYTIKPPTTGGNFELYRIELVDGVPTNTATATLLSSSGTQTPALPCSNCANANRVNAFSYNPSQNNVFFFNSNTTKPELYSVQAVANGEFQLVATLTTIPDNTNLSGAAFFNDTIYTIANNSSTIYTIPVSYNGSSISVGTVASFSISVGGNRPYGDIAIDPVGKILYGYSTTGGTFTDPVFFAYDISNPTPALITAPTVTSPAGVQIAFGNADADLYGVDASSAWYRVNRSSGLTQSYAANTANAASLGTITDLAGGYPVPGPLPLFGAAAAFRASRQLRARIKSAGKPSEANC